VSSSGTYDFSPSNGELVLAAYERVQVRLPELRQEHMLSARRELNFLFASWSNNSPNLWEVVLRSQALTQGTATYSVNANTIMVLDAYISLNQGTSQQTDRYIAPISRTNYASFANKQTQGEPTSYWFDRLIAPSITLWPVPDGNGPYMLNYYCCTQMQDASLPSGETPDVPYRWFDAIVAGLAYRLARIYAPPMEKDRKADAMEAWTIAAAQDTENVAFTLAPGLGGYYRR
jgi:hypothetical protein